MAYNLTLPGQIAHPDLGQLTDAGNAAPVTFYEHENASIIVPVPAGDQVTQFVAQFSTTATGTTFPHAVLFHRRTGDYQVYKINDYDEVWHEYQGNGSPMESALWNPSANGSVRWPNPLRSKIIPYGSGCQGIGYAANERSLYLKTTSGVYKVNKYTSNAVFIVVAPSTGIFGSDYLYLLNANSVAEYASTGSLNRTIPLTLGWAPTSGAKDAAQRRFFLMGVGGSLATVDNNGSLISQTAVVDGATNSGFTIIGFNGEYLVLANNNSRKFYWVDPATGAVISSTAYLDQISSSSYSTFDGRDILTVDPSSGIQYTFAVQDNWQYTASTYSSPPKANGTIGATTRVTTKNALFIYYPYDSGLRGAPQAVPTVDRIKPDLAYCDANGVAQSLLFDGLIFHTSATLDLNGNWIEASPLASWTRSHQDYYLNFNFNAGGLADVVAQCVRQIRQELNLPNYRAKFHLHLNGLLSGGVSDFQYMIDQTIARAANYPELELRGFYYGDEAILAVMSTGHSVSDYCRAKGLEFLWCPAAGRGDITNYAPWFDINGYQTNYYWNGTNWPYTGGHEYWAASNLNKIVSNWAPCSLDVEGSEDALYFRMFRDRIHQQMDMLMSYGMTGDTPKVWFQQYVLFQKARSSTSPFERELYDTIKDFITNNRAPGRTRAVFSGGDYGITLQSAITADVVKITPLFTNNTPQTMSYGIVNIDVLTIAEGASTTTAPPTTTTSSPGGTTTTAPGPTTSAPPTTTTTTTTAPGSTTTGAPGNTTTAAPGTTTTAAPGTTTTSAPTPPPSSAPVVSLVGASGSFTASWQAVAGATSYELYYSVFADLDQDAKHYYSGSPSPYGVAPSSSNGHLTTAELSAVCSNLTANGYYYVRVRAINSGGAGPLSAAQSVQASAPGPTSPVITLTPGNGQITVSLATGGVGATSWRGDWNAQGVDPYWALGDAGFPITLPWVITGLTNGVAYEVFVVAVNSDGESYSSIAAATPSAASTTTSAAPQNAAPTTTIVMTLLPDGSTTTSAPTTTSTAAPPSTTTAAPGTTTTLPPTSTTTTSAPATTSTTTTTTTTAAPRPLVLALQTSTGVVQFAATSGGALQIRTSTGIVDIALGDTPGAVAINTTKGVKYLQ